MFSCRFQMVFLQSVFLFLLTTFICTWGKDIPTAVAFKCGKPSLYLTPLGWNVDDEQSCLHREKDIIAYCQRVYNDTSLMRVAFTTVIEVALPNWCHVNRSDCPPTLANRTTYPIQPWICSGAPPSQLTVPVNCSLRRIDDPRHEGYSCHKADYWKRAAGDACKSNHTTLFNSMPIKPCIRVGSYGTMHYLGADIVCCSSTPLPQQPQDTYDHDWSQSLTGFSQSVIGSADTSLIITNDERLYTTYLNAVPDQSTENKAHENQRYKAAKSAENEAFTERKNILESQLSSAEFALSASDWSSNPKQTQEAEDALHKEFFRKYMALDEQQREIDSRLDKTHWRRILESMEHHRQMALEQWSNTVENPKSNLTTIKHAAGHLLHTLENQRAHVIRRFNHARVTNPSEWRHMLPEVRQHLSNSEHLLSNSLAKLDRLPAYKSAVINHVQHLRNTHYAETDASAKSIAVMSDRELPEGLRFPSPNEEAALRAEKLIMQHEHHHMTHSEGKKYPPGVTPKSIQPNKSSAGAVDHAEHQNIDLPQPAQSHLATKTTEHPVHRSESHAIVVSYPKAVDSRPPESTEDIVVEIHLPTQRPTPLPTAVASDVGHALSETTASPKSKKAQIVTPAVLACLVFLVAVILVARCYVRRMRLRRAGYNLTVVEVDEVADTETTMGHGSHLPRLARGRLTTSALSSGGNSVSGASGVGSGMPSIGVTSLCEDHDPVDPLARWQMNGYENPAYKFTEGGYIFSPAE